ncbi:MAG TPA: DUF255 domain-containing protein [Tepidisphaeraceae bacterium]|nr:DUF255 domain-containing protein [Tepidisphaeraceae bacterium]
MPDSFTNRLAAETSPYLLQHAHNPVDWYPWGDEAIAAARRLDKPIFLSVGYSTCYWCHVMERESFENPAIAAEMNRRFICIKVDREERPDVDQLYMTAVQLMTRQGGWPMSVFLTPGLLPFHAGTYFAPDDRYGRPGFPRLLAAIDDAWRNRKLEVVDFALSLARRVEVLSQPPAPKSPITVDEKWIDVLIDRSVDDYDSHFGGFGGAPKFPRQTLLELLLVRNRHRADDKKMKMVLHTLDAMADGGIHDHLGGAFHRYSTDERWLVPHFEIMLYDNALLTWIYAEAHAQTGIIRYARIARGIADFVMREMTSPEGGFFTALDAEVDAREGGSYLWTAAEIDQILGGDSSFFKHAYGVDRGPNFADPHHGDGKPDSNILYLPEAIDDATEARLVPLREKLYSARRQRKQPLLDTKIITSWNALMVRGLAHLGRAVGDEKYLEAARRAAAFLLNTGRKRGFLDDYAFLAQALLDLEDVTSAQTLAAQMRELFYDADDGGFYFTPASASDLFFRQKIATDSPLPSGNAVAAAVFLALDDTIIAQRTVGLFAAQTQAIGESMSSMVQVADEFVRRHGSFVVSAPTPESQAAAENVVTLAAEWPQPNLLRVHVAIADGFHLNTHHAPAGLKATHLAVQGDVDEIGAIDYPAGQLAQLAISEDPIPVYTGRFAIDVHFSGGNPSRKVSLALSYQACTDSACLAPAVARLQI